MATTQLFVELLVIGIGALVWVLLFCATLLGVDITLLATVQKTPAIALAPFLGLVYVLGILNDRLADWIFGDLWGDPLDVVYKEKTEAERQEQRWIDRRTLVVDGPELWFFIEYGRSRLRICRGWALNAVLIASAWSLYLELGAADASSLQAPRLHALSIPLLAMALLCWISWRKLQLAEFRKTKRQAEWVRNGKPSAPPDTSEPDEPTDPSAADNPPNDDQQ